MTAGCRRLQRLYVVDNLRSCLVWKRCEESRAKRNKLDSGTYVSQVRFASGPIAGGGDELELAAP